jgi:hypothetical protein
MKRFVFFLPIAASLAMVGCANVAQQPGVMFDRILSGPLHEGSVFREGDKLNFEISESRSPEGGMPQSAQIEASCSSNEVRLMYLDGPQGRRYVGGVDYQRPQAVTGKLSQALRENASFRQACTNTQKPDWRVVRGGESKTWILLDSNSIRKQSGVVTFWGSFDYPDIRLDLPYNAPYAQKREHFAVDCAGQTYRLLAGYDLDAGNQVTDGKVFDKPDVQPIAASSEDYALLFAQVCTAPERLGQLASFEPRIKAPLSLDMPPVRPEVLAAITGLQLTPPPKKLSYLKIEGTSTYKGKASPLLEEKFLSEDTQSSQVKEDLRGDDYEASEITWRGLIELASSSKFTRMSDTSWLKELSFTGDWQDMPLGAQLSYSKVQLNINSAAGEYGGEREVTRCTVERSLPASELHTRLSGQARELSCSVDGDKYERVFRHIYLVDYGYFLSMKTDKNPFYFDDRRLTDVK